MSESAECIASQIAESRGLRVHNLDMGPNGIFRPDTIRLPLNIMPITGAFLGKAYMIPYANALKQKFGQEVHIFEPDYERSDRTLDDSAEEIIDGMGDRDNVVFNPHSRPYEATIRALKILKDRRQLDRVTAVVPLNTGGSHIIDSDLIRHA